MIDTRKLFYRPATEVAEQARSMIVECNAVIVGLPVDVNKLVLADGEIFQLRAGT